MPYVGSIPKEERRNPQYLKAIKKQLKKFAKNGFVYREIRWRHVGRRQAKFKVEIVLVDLGSLVEMDPTETIDSAVERQIGVLNDRDGVDPAQPDALPLVCQS